ncbi:MAG: hypothetical protein RLZZ387_821 [Chloroflexota bacterium]
MADNSTAEDASRTEKAYQAILGAIASMALKPGDALTQDRLARWLSISRTPVREALRRLEQDGLIQNVPGRGLVVAELTARDVEDMLEVLRLLGPHAAALAARRRSDAQAARITAAAQALVGAVIRGDAEELATADVHFQDALLEACDNMVLQRYVRDLRRRLQRFTLPPAAEATRLASYAADHQAVAEAVAAGNAEAAARLMRAHMDALGDGAMTLIRSYIVPVRGERF